MECFSSPAGYCCLVHQSCFSSCLKPEERTWPKYKKFSSQMKGLLEKAIQHQIQIATKIWPFPAEFHITQEISCRNDVTDLWLSFSIPAKNCVKAQTDPYSKFIYPYIAICKVSIKTVSEECLQVRLQYNLFSFIPIKGSILIASFQCKPTSCFINNSIIFLL